MCNYQNSPEYQRLLVNRLPLIKDNYISTFDLHELLKNHYQTYNLKKSVGYSKFINIIDEIICDLSLRIVNLDNNEIPDEPNYDEIYLELKPTKNKSLRKIGYLLNKRQTVFLMCNISKVLTNLLMHKLDNKVCAKKNEQEIN